MKKQFIIIYLIIITLCLNAENEFKTKISKAIVYKSGAMITRSAKITLKKGRNQILLKELPVTLDENSLSINFEKYKKIEIIDFTLENTKISKNNNNSSVKIIESNSQKKLKLLQKKNEIINRKRFYQELTNSFLSGVNSSETPLSYKEIGEYTKKSFLTENKQEIEINDIDKEIIELAQKNSAILRKISAKKITEDRKYKELKVIIESNYIGELNFDISYLMRNASWKPHYNSYFFSDTPASLFEYMATVKQSTGENWDNIKIVISEDKPYIKSKKIVNKIDKDVFKSSGTTGKIKGVVTDENGDPLAGANITVEGTTLGSESDADGYYYIIGVRAGSYKVKCQFIGYSPVTNQVKLRTGLTTKRNFKMSPMDFELDQICFVSEKEDHVRRDVTTSQRTIKFNSDGSQKLRVGYSNQMDGISFSDPTGAKSTYSSTVYKKRATSNYLSSKVNYSNYSSDFILPGNYTIESGNNVKINLAKIDFISKKTLYAIPDLSNKLFAEEKFINNSGLTLSQGQINYYRDNSFISSNTMRKIYQGDSLVVSFGKNRDIILKRQVYETHSIVDKIFSKNKLVTIKIVTTLKNTKNDTKDIIIKDVLPLSRNNDLLTVTLKNKDFWNTKIFGTVSKKIKLDPKETKTIEYEYKIEYPNDMQDITF